MATIQLTKARLSQEKSPKNTREKTIEKKTSLVGDKSIISNKVAHTKKNLIAALTESMGLVTTACKKAKISRSTFYKYYHNDPDFKAEVDAINEYAIDEAESLLRERMRSKNTPSIIFYLKTKGKKRGYVEKQEIAITKDSSIALLEKIANGEIELGEEE